MTATEQQIARENAAATLYASLPEPTQPSAHAPEDGYTTMLCNSEWLTPLAQEIAAYDYEHPLDAGEQAQVGLFADLNDVPRNIKRYNNAYYFVTYLKGKQRYLIAFVTERLEHAVRFADAFTHFFSKYRTRRKQRWNFVTKRGAKDCENEPGLALLLKQLEAVLLAETLISSRGPKAGTIREAVSEQMETRFDKLAARVEEMAINYHNILAVNREFYKLVEQIKVVNLDTREGLRGMREQLKRLEDAAECQGLAALAKLPPEGQPADGDLGEPVTLEKIVVTPIFGDAAD